MCGIAGILDVTRSDFDRVGLARELLLQIERRGRHATGYAFVSDDSTVIEKADLPASEFVDVAPLFTDGISADPRAIILHTRYATQGSPRNNMNNHPIHSKISRLTLIHNGWLTNEDAVLKKFRLQKDGEVDSETVLRLIEHFLGSGRRSINRAIKLAMKELKGVFACALISEKYPNTLWLWRDNNPLHVVRDTDSGAFIFASTADLLRDALRLSGFDGEIKEFPNATIARFVATDGGELKAKFENLKVRKRPDRPAKKTPTVKPHVEATGRSPVNPRECDSIACFLRREKKERCDGYCGCKCHAPKPKHQQSTFPTLEAWDAWKKQGEKIKKILH